MELKINDTLKREDINILSLRHLYGHHGYVHYKMNKFEEYDLYVENKDFLVSDRIITFTDTNGKLMALKPDVTLSIVKNYQDVPGMVQKVYYNENIYRTSKNTKTYKEIIQMGLECIGDLDIYNISEVLLLAIKSLQIFSDNYILDLSHMGIISGLMKEMNLNAREEKHFLALLQEKNCHGIRSLCQNKDLDKDTTNLAIAIAQAYGPFETILNAIKPLVKGKAEMENAISELETIGEILDPDEMTNVYLDFSIVNDMSYYNGVLFRGYINGIPFGILSGGQYDELMDKLGKTAGAIGFGINLDLLEEQYSVSEDYDGDVLILYSREDNPKEILCQVKDLTSKGYTVSCQKIIPPKKKYKKIMKLENGGLAEIEADN